jgi:hypothetical protein
MAGRQVLRLDEGAAAGAVELDDAAPLGVGSETVLAFDDRRVDLTRIAVSDQATLLVVLARAAEVVVAAVAGPALRLRIEVEVLGDPSLRQLRPPRSGLRCRTGRPGT